MDIHQTTAVHNHEMSFTHTINGHKIISDSNGEGNKEEGPSPKRLMLAALAGCTGIDVVSILNKMKVGFSDFSIDTSATLTEEHPKIYKEVTVTYSIRLAESDQSKMEKAVHLSEEKYCGVSAMFKAFATVKTQINFLPPL